MNTVWDLDVNVITFTLSDRQIDRQLDEYPLIIDLDRNGDVVEIEVVLPIQLDIARRILAAGGIDDESRDSILNTLSYGNMSALMLGTPTIPQSPYVADPAEREFQVA
jgi:hypothetical protein